MTFPAWWHILRACCVDSCDAGFGPSPNLTAAGDEGHEGHEGLFAAFWADSCGRLGHWEPQPSQDKTF